MLRIFIIQKIINFFDFFQQRKIFSFLKKKINQKCFSEKLLNTYIKIQNLIEDFSYISYF